MSELTVRQLFTQSLCHSFFHSFYPFQYVLRARCCVIVPLTPYNAVAQEPGAWIGAPFEAGEALMGGEKDVLHGIFDGGRGDSEAQQRAPDLARVGGVKPRDVRRFGSHGGEQSTHRPVSVASGEFRHQGLAR